MDYCVDSRTLLSDLCFDHSVNSTDLTAQFSRFLFLSVHRPKISTALERIAQIYLPYLPLFASLPFSLVAKLDVVLPLPSIFTFHTSLNLRQTGVSFVCLKSASGLKFGRSALGRKRSIPLIHPALPAPDSSDPSHPVPAFQHNPPADSCAS